MRTFIAVNIPDDVKDVVGDYIESIKNGFHNSVKWVSPANLHFTIKFLGEIRESDLGTLKECVSKAAAAIGPFEIGLDGVGFFPSESKPRVVWLGADDGADNLLEIFQELETCLEDHGYDRDAKPFSPHLTVGRAKKNGDIKTPARFEDFGPVQFVASGLAIYKSTLTPQGPEYEMLFEKRFTGASETVSNYV